MAASWTQGYFFSFALILRYFEVSVAKVFPHFERAGEGVNFEKMLC